MKNFIFILAGLVFFSACREESCTQVYYDYEPIYMSAEELENFTFEAPRDIEIPGKIYVYKNLLLVNEVHRGIHFFDNSDQTNPVNLGFLKIKGNVDIAIKDDILYADSYTAMLAIDIKNPTQPQKIGAERDAFNGFYHYDVENEAYLVDYIITETEQRVDCNDEFFFEDFIVNAGGVSSDANAVQTGQGGSFARFAIENDYLYTVDFSTITTYDISNPENLAQLNSTNIGWGIETIFPYEDHFFIGAIEGLYIFDKADPSNPQYVSEFVHARACDPVVVQDDLAYVTLRSGNTCDGFTNQLDVIDVSEITEPQLLASHTMDSPHGLGIKDDFLYICDGYSGVKVFDHTDSYAINENLLAQVPDHFAYDIILLNNNTAIVLGLSDFYQYDVSDPSNIQLLSSIKYYPQ
ncbi:MAG: hypothetical protein KTR13_05515 [Saprospiraceae bacterium]|nr:hypothetical protein [Saprospiraceae bacterium]